MNGIERVTAKRGDDRESANSPLRILSHVPELNEGLGLVTANAARGIGCTRTIRSRQRHIRICVETDDGSEISRTFGERSFLHVHRGRTAAGPVHSLRESECRNTFRSVFVQSID